MVDLNMADSKAIDIEEQHGIVPVEKVEIALVVSLSDSPD